MKSTSGKAFAKVLERHGWKLLRVHGSHHIHGKTGSILRFSVPIHGNTSLQLGRFKDIRNQAGLSEVDFDSNPVIH